MLKNVFLIRLSFIGFSRRLEGSSDKYSSQTDENRAWKPTPIPVSTYQPIADDSGSTKPEQNINGANKVMDVSGKIIRINGNYDEIRIINKDISKIWLNGQGNVVYYPKEGRPLINGLENVIKTY